MEDSSEQMQERLDEVGQKIDDVRNQVESNVPGLDLDPEEKFTEHEQAFVDSGDSGDRGDEADNQDDQTIAPPG